MAVAAFVVTAVLAWVGWFVAGRHALPPRTIVMATGPGGGAYAELARRYQAVLREHGLEVQLRATEGDAENLALLRNPGSRVDVAFLQSGMTTAEASPGIESLGTMFLQPIWVFRRGEARYAFADLRGRKLAAGGEQSGTRPAVKRLLAIAGIDPGSIELPALQPLDAAAALRRGDLDAMAIVATWDSPVVRELAGAPGISIDGFPRADAYVALDRSLEKLVLPQGVGDMARDRPPRDVRLLALKVSLVVPRELHAAIQYLLLDAATDVHGEPGVFQAARQFPVAEAVDLPLSSDARRYYRSGRPFLQRYLPYWIAVLVERLLLALLPVVGVLVPLARLVPAAYGAVMKRRIIRLYGELKMLEADLEGVAPGDPAADLAGRLDELQGRADHLRVPLNFAQRLYTLKQHIELVRDRLRSRS